MTKRGTRSSPARQRRYAARLVSRHSHKDRERDENTNVLTQLQIRDSVVKRFGSAAIEVIKSWSLAEILRDGRGRGTLQRFESE